MMARRFTLVELVAVIVILGVLGAIGTMGLGAATQGFVRGRDRLDLAQATQTAMQRAVLELRFMTFDPDTSTPNLTITGGGTSIQFGSRRDAATHVLEKVGTELQLDGKVLLDHVADFLVAYSATSGELTITTTVEGIGAFSTSLFP